MKTVHAKVLCVFSSHSPYTKPKQISTSTLMVEEIF